MAKQKFKITNWKTYNDASRHRGSLTVWLSDHAAAWYAEAVPERHGKPLHNTDTAITTARILKIVFHLNLLALQEFVDSFFQMMDVPLYCPDYSRISKRSWIVNVNIKTRTALLNK